jgi:hypothetical protein
MIESRDAGRNEEAKADAAVIAIATEAPEEMKQEKAKLQLRAQVKEDLIQIVHAPPEIAVPEDLMRQRRSRTQMHHEDPL